MYGFGFIFISDDLNFFKIEIMWNGECSLRNYWQIKAQIILVVFFNIVLYYNQFV